MTKRIEGTKELAEFLESTGLMFEINRLVLHPRGLALCVTGNVVDNKFIAIDGNAVSVIDWRDDPEGGVFAGELYEEGVDKLAAYDCSQEQAKRETKRMETLGFVVQDRRVAHVK